jgi:hypothetical protein
LFRLEVGATVNPAGNVSANASPLSVALLFGFDTVKVSEVVPFSGRLAAPNAFVIVGGLATVRFAVPVFPVPPLVEVTAPVVLV